MTIKTPDPATRRELMRGFGYLVNDVSRLLRKAFDRRMRELGITRAQWMVVGYLYVGGDGLTQTELADQLDMEKAPVGKLIDRLEKSEWLERRLDPTDRRVRRIFLTDRVAGILEPMIERAEAVREASLAGIPKDDRDRLTDMLERVKGNLIDLGTDQPS